MLNGVPRAFLVLLAIYFLLDVVDILIAGNIFYLARTAVLAFAGWRALRGSRPAVVFLAALMSLGAIAGLYGAYKIYEFSLSRAIGQLIFVAFLGSIVGYIFLSPKLKSFYVASSLLDRWRLVCNEMLSTNLSVNTDAPPAALRADRGSPVTLVR